MQFSSYLTILLLIGMVWAAWWWLSAAEEHTIVHILASQEPALGLPVYAQFTAAQTVALDRPAVLARLVVPMYISSPDAGLIVDLRSDEKLLWRWRVRLDSTGIVQVDLPLPELTVPDGQLEVSFSAAQVGHDRAHEATRLFVEPDDSKYEPGNYLVAENQKQGDISLKIVEQRGRWDRIRESILERPLKQMALAGGWALLGVLGLALPAVAASVARPRGAE